MALNLADANRVVQATIAKADEIGIKVSVAVCDTGGRLVAFNRMDGAIWASVYGAQGKAVTSAAFGRPSGAVAADSPVARAVAAAAGGMIPGGQGAVPIIRNGVVDGACGVGGGTSQQDEDCASAGAAVL